MAYYFQSIKRIIFQRLIQPIITSVSPVNEVALGTAIGIFVGLTPTVGIQMWIVFMIWLFCKYILKIRFDLVISTALVWISNPITMFFLYYGFLVTGYSVLSLLGMSQLELSYSMFNSQFSQIINSSKSSTIEAIINGTRFLLFDLGYPMMLGSMVYAAPSSILSFVIIRKTLKNYRMRKAKKMGIDYERWRQEFVRK